MKGVEEVGLKESERKGQSTDGCTKGKEMEKRRVMDGKKEAEG